jgi:hypothetical protein
VGRADALLGDFRSAPHTWDAAAALAELLLCPDAEPAQPEPRTQRLTEVAGWLITADWWQKWTRCMFIYILRRSRSGI